MQDRDHTQVELDKMNEAVNYLRNINLINEKEFKQLEAGL